MAANARKIAPKVDPEIQELACKKWKSSGLSDDHAKTLGLRPINKEDTWETMKKGGAKEPMEVGSMVIPYFSLDGKRTDFFRLRFLGKLPGWAGAAKKPQRFFQPSGTLNEVYFPPILQMSWREVAKDAKIPIYITEGELKAAAGCSVGLAVLGLGGVDVWRSTKRGIDLLPALKEIEWKGRLVVIVYDSDAAVNPNVIRAQRQLAQELVCLGAAPAIATIPPAKDGSKMGMDDLLVKDGQEALAELLKEAPYYPESDALWSMNEEVVYVRDPGVVVELRTGLRFVPTRFVNDAYSDRHYVETQMVKGAPISKKKPLAKRWMEWEGRFKAEHMTYAPGKPKIYEGTYNTWPGWAVEPRHGDVAPWKWLLGYLFKSDPGQREWFEKWCAYPLQHPGTKLYTSVMIWGREQGTGKSLVAYSLMGIYGRNAVEIKNKDLRGGFNGWAKDKQFVYGDEISGNEARIDADWLKGLITQPEVRINEKYLPAYVTPDQINYLFSSNHPDALFMEDDDRRNFVHEVVGGPANREMYEMYHHWLHGDGPMGSYRGKGAAALFDYLLRMDLTGFNPREKAPYTRSKEAMVLNSKSDIGMWCVLLREDPVNQLKTLGERVSTECDLFTPTMLLHAYDPEGKKKVTAPGLGRELIRAGFRQINCSSPVRTKAGLLRWYAVRNKEKWDKASPAEIAKYCDRFFGPGTGKYS